jgi:hypothetical protein
LNDGKFWNGTDLLNLYPDPRLKGNVPFSRSPDGSDLVTGRGFYVHVHADAKLERRGDGFGLRVSGRGSASNESLVCPGGRRGAIRLGMEAGHRYVFAADVTLERPLQGFLAASALRIVARWSIPSDNRPKTRRSAPAANIPGSQRLSVEFRIPDDAYEAWIVLRLGAFGRSGSAIWSNFSLTEGDTPPSFFDGDSPDTSSFHYRWTGEPYASPSRRIAQTEDRSPEELADIASVVSIDRDLPTVRLVRDRLPADSAAELVCEAALAERSNPARAAELCRVALKRDPGQFAARQLLARIAAAAHRDADLIDALLPAQDDQRMTPQLSYELGRALHRSKRRNAAAAAFNLGASRDPQASGIDVERLMSTNYRRLPSRMYVWRFFEPRMSELRDRAKRSQRRQPSGGKSENVFVYWAQGIENAPEIVKSCYRSISRFAGRPVVTLRDEDLHEWVDLDPRVVNRTADLRAHFSDILRVELLKKHGGIWLDATCLLTERLPPSDELLGRSDFFAFRRSETQLSSWCLAARRSSYIVHMLSAALQMYWESHDQLIEYFLLHSIFEVLNNLDDRFFREWSARTDLDVEPACLMQRSMYKPFEPTSWAQLSTGSFVHKLTYKLDGDRPTDGSIYEHALNSTNPEQVVLANPAR